MSKKFVRHYVIESIPSGKGFSFNIIKQKYAVVKHDPSRDWNDEKYGAYYLLENGWSTSYWRSIHLACGFDKWVAQAIVDELNALLPNKGAPYES